jgi:hypothetical protein
MALERRERKIIIISGLALLVAVVTFGVLDSSGAFKNSAYDLGGAIVGFIATAFALNKFYGSDDGEIPKHELKGQPFSSEESVKILDMRNQTPVDEGKPHENRVVLIDHYKLRKLGTDSDVVFNYATSGLGMEGLCMTPQLNYEWKDTTEDPGELGKDKHLKKSYEIHLKVGDIAKNQIIYVHNAVTYFNAFDRKDKEYFHTHVNFPTLSLTVILLFPEGQPCKDISGFEAVGKNKNRVVDREKGTPVILDYGKLVYWRIANPLFGAEYQLEWLWDNSVQVKAAASPV